MSDLIDYYRRGGPCIDYNDECRDRSSGCPCTETAEALRKQQERIGVLEGALQECQRLADSSVDDHEPNQHLWLSSVSKACNAALTEDRP